MTATDHIRKALADVRTRTLAQAAQSVQAEVARAEERGRREVMAAFGESLLRALPSILGGFGVRQGHSAVSGEIAPQRANGDDSDALSALLKAMVPETPAGRLERVTAELGVNAVGANYLDVLRFVKATEPEEYERLLWDVADAMALEDLDAERLTKADRSHLVRKVITNRLGHRQVVWVRPQDGETPRGASAGQAAHAGNPTHAGGAVTLTQEQKAESRSIVAKAVSDPNALNPEQVKLLAAHVNAITKEDAKGLLRVLGQKLGGDQIAVAQRLVAAIRAGRQKGHGVGDALERAGHPVTGQYGAWGRAAGGGEKPASRDEFPKRGVGPGETVEAAPTTTPVVEPSAKDPTAAIHAAVAAAIRDGKEVPDGYGGKVVPMSALRAAVAHLPRDQQDEAILEATHRHGLKSGDADGYRVKLTAGMTGVHDETGHPDDLTIGQAGGSGSDRPQRFPAVEVEGDDRDRLLAKHGKQAAAPKPAAPTTLTTADGETLSFTHPRSQALAAEVTRHQAAGRDTSAAEVALGNVSGSEEGLSDRDHKRLLARRLSSAHRDAVRLGKHDAADVVDSLLTGEHVGAQRIGEVGATVPFNPTHHESDSSVSTGQPVTVERGGHRIVEGKGTEYVAGKAKVSAVRPEKNTDKPTEFTIPQFLGGRNVVARFNADGSERIENQGKSRVITRNENGALITEVIDRETGKQLSAAYFRGNREAAKTHKPGDFPIDMTGVPADQVAAFKTDYNAATNVGAARQVALAAARHRDRLREEAMKESDKNDAASRQAKRDGIASKTGYHPIAPQSAIDTLRKTGLPVYQPAQPRSGVPAKSGVRVQQVPGKKTWLTVEYKHEGDGEFDHEANAAKMRADLEAAGYETQPTRGDPTILTIRKPVGSTHSSTTPGA